MHSVVWSFSCWLGRSIHWSFDLSRSGKMTNLQILPTDLPAWQPGSLPANNNINSISISIYHFFSLCVFFFNLIFPLLRILASLPWHFVVPHSDEKCMHYFSKNKNELSELFDKFWTALILTAGGYRWCMSVHGLCVVVCVRAALNRTISRSLEDTFV